MGDLFLTAPRFFGNAELRDVLNGRGTLKRGSRGEAVKLIQQAFIDLGEAMSAGADGIFGLQTHDAVVRFQMSNGLTADGIIGRNTMSVLDATIAAHDNNNPPPQPPQTVLKNVRFWINAFVPGPQLSAYAFPAPGPSSGKSYFKEAGIISGAFLGDNRNYSSDPNAPARMHMLVDLINLDTPAAAMVIPNDIKCAEYVEIDAATGAVIATKPASTARCRFFDLQVGPGTGSVITLRFEGAVNNPLQAGSLDIDMNGTIRIDRTALNITVEAKVEPWPAFEAWVSGNGGPAKFVALGAPTQPGDQAGQANREFTVTTGLL
ncbi:hypothetical protein BU26DRAFT_184190 [Trematosphaeria pertusa]|uniref:Peptidoglycan binding-like domain-containing protein n=1 Tax=Trematosphaeria pertusa TaxID=390896 RepID=A0A6A6HU19_9PLEO|nr:uncharacterized protein BU26DRAFT_184190 [Trematosphaeria pertusa]KAF2241282.1 hypothetical protein BU26DRAFT_184190 [Trematosphaeria pertusa]